MIAGGTGGGSTKTGLVFEERVDLIAIFEQIEGYSIKETDNKSGVHIYYETFAKLRYSQS